MKRAPYNHTRDLKNKRITPQKISIESLKNEKITLEKRSMQQPAARPLSEYRHERYIL